MLLNQVIFTARETTMGKMKDTQEFEILTKTLEY